VNVVLLGGPMDGTELAVAGIPPTIDFARISDPVAAMTAEHSEPIEAVALYREVYRRTGRISARRHIYRYEGTHL
jgi:hypothetical protein